jgi:hypothetical protein
MASDIAIALNGTLFIIGPSLNFAVASRSLITDFASLDYLHRESFLLHLVLLEQNARPGLREPIF